MKPIHSVAIAAIATAFFVALAIIDPAITFDDAVMGLLGVWCMNLGNIATMKLLNLKPKAHEKAPPITPSL